MGDEIYREELHETRLNRVLVQIVCSRCNNNTFTATKIVTPYPGREEMVSAGVLARDGFGWKISDMGIRCAKCGGDPKVDIQPMANGDAARESENGK